jgi:Ca2+/Na+ antiporter
MPETASTVWLSFGICVAVIGIAGVKLTVYGDAIADKVGMGGSWVGLILIATVTSLPEFASGLTAVTVAGLPDIAAVSPAHLVSTTMAMTMTGVVIVGLFFGSRRRLLGLGGWESLMLYGLFALNSWLAFAAGGH